MNPRHPIDRASTIPTAARVHQGHGAGIVSRLIAAGLDLVVVIVLLLAAYGGWSITLFVLDTRAFTFPRPSPLLIVVAYMFVAISYLTISWWVSGRSYGTPSGLRVTTQRGDRLGSRARSCARGSVSASRSACSGWSSVDATQPRTTCSSTRS